MAKLINLKEEIEALGERKKLVSDQVGVGGTVSSTYVCMYAYMYRCMYVFMHVCMYVCIYVCTYVCMYVYLLNCT